MGPKLLLVKPCCQYVETHYFYHDISLFTLVKVFIVVLSSALKTDVESDEESGDSEKETNNVSLCRSAVSKINQITA